MDEFLVTADWHVHTFSDGGEPVDGVNRRLRDQLDALGQMIEYAESHKIRRTYVLGDIFHLKKNVPEQARNLLYLLLMDGRKKGIEFIFLAGNHDRENDRDDVVTILSFRAFARVITEIEVDKDERTVFVPWLYDQQKIIKYLNALKGQWDLLFYHGELEGAFVGPGDFLLPSIMKAESMNLKRFERSFAGHLHRRQYCKGVWYPGSPYAISYGEPELDKGFLHVSPTGVHVVGLRSPKFLTYELDTLSERDIKTMQIAGNFIRLILGQSPDPGLMKKIWEKHPRDVKVRLRPVKIEKLAEFRLNFNLETLIDEYVELVQPDPDLRERYAEYGKQMIRGLQ